MNKVILEIEFEDRKEKDRWPYSAAKKVTIKGEDGEEDVEVPFETESEGEQLYRNWHIELDQNNTVDISAAYTED